jgi:hypothetical protein
MGQNLHGSATTTQPARAAIQRSCASASELSRTCESEEGQKTIRSIVFQTNPKTVLKWRKRATVEDRRTGCVWQCPVDAEPCPGAGVLSRPLQGVEHCREVLQ